MAQTIKIKIYPSLEEAAKDDSFFIVNNSDGSGARPKGQIIFAVKGQDGTTTPVIIPPTWIPLDLRSYVTKEDLMASNVLRDYVRKQIVLLINPESAKGMMAHEDYRKEYERVNKIVSIVTKATEIEYSVGTVAQNNGGVTANGIIAIETPITQAILNASSDREMVEQFDKMLPGIAIGELKWISQKSPIGSTVQLIAMELESEMMTGQLKIKSVKETDSYKISEERGLTSAPQFSF